MARACSCQHSRPSAHEVLRNPNKRRRRRPGRSLSNTSSGRRAVGAWLGVFGRPCCVPGGYTCDHDVRLLIVPACVGKRALWAANAECCCRRHHAPWRSRMAGLCPAHAGARAWQRYGSWLQQAATTLGTLLCTSWPGGRRARHLATCQRLLSAAALCVQGSGVRESVAPRGRVHAHCGCLLHAPSARAGCSLLMLCRAAVAPRVNARQVRVCARSIHDPVYGALRLEDAPCWDLHGASVGGWSAHIVPVSANPVRTVHDARVQHAAVRHGALRRRGGRHERRALDRAGICLVRVRFSVRHVRVLRACTSRAAPAVACMP